VVLEAATSTKADFVITNSGPAVSPFEQEAYSTRRTLQRLGWSESETEHGVAAFSKTMDLLRQPFEVGWPQAEKLPALPDLIDAGVFIPRDAALWSFASRIMEHDPRPALRGLAAPLLAVYGEDDDVVPVDPSVEVLQATVQPALLDVRILPGADHRIQLGDDFADGYLDVLVDFIDRVVR
jgi:pimeloyl-ACP methyl ester carboxylesterase